MEIKNIKDAPDDILTSLNILGTRDCQPGKFSLIELRAMATNTDILYLFEKETPVYFLLLDQFPKHKTVYIHDVCVNKLHRGKSLFKKSLTFLKRHYSKKGYRSFTLDASNSTREKGLNQKARLYIFHSAGFDVNPETGYFTATGDYKVIKTKVVLDTKEIVEIQKKEGDAYLVKNKKGEESSVTIDQIEKCLDSELHPISCPMILHISSKKGTLRKTRKHRGS